MIEIEVLSRHREEMPIVMNQKKVDTSMENLLDDRPITLRNEKERAILMIQEGICSGFRRFLEEQEFTEFIRQRLFQKV